MLLGVSETSRLGLTFDPQPQRRLEPVTAIVEPGPEVCVVEERKAVSRWRPFRLPTIGNLSHTAHSPKMIEPHAERASGADDRVLEREVVLRDVGAMHGTYTVSDDSGASRQRGGRRFPRRYARR